MSSVEYLREFVSERLTATAEEIFGVFVKTIVEYQQEIDRQRRLLDIVLKPEIKLQRIELPQQHVCKEEEEEVLCDQQHQERNSSLDQEDPEPPQIKEEQEELCTSQEGEQLELKQETETFMSTPTYEERDHGEDQTLCLNPNDSLAVKAYEVNIPVGSLVQEENLHVIFQSRDQRGGKNGDTGSTRKAEAEVKHQNQPRKRSPINNVLNATMSSHCNTQDKPVFQCDMCNKMFKYRSRLQSHLLIHTSERPHFYFKTLKCDTCGKAFIYQSSLNVHLRVHSGEKPYSCNTCGKGFSQMSSLNCHTRIHTGEKPYSCNTCGKGFSQMSSLNSHTRIHTGEKPHSCKTCGKRFCRKSALNTHITIHTSERPYTCGTCGKGFRLNKELTAHKRIHMGEIVNGHEKPFACLICGNTFKLRRYLADHKRRAHIGLKL